MRTLYDAVDPSQVPAEAANAMVAGYIDGWYQSYNGLVARFPNAVHLKIAVHAGTNDGVIGDMETGDMTPENCVDWVLMRRQAGVHPTIYCSEAAWWAVASSFQRRGVPEPEYWIAAYPGNGEQLYPGAVAHQWFSVGGYDKSIVADHWPGVDDGGGAVAHHNAGAQMLIQDNTNGKIWLIGPGKSHWVGSMDDVNRLLYVGVPNAGFADPLTVIGWMKTFGAW